MKKDIFETNTKSGNYINRDIKRECEVSNMKKLLAVSSLVVFLCGCSDPISLPEDLKSNLGKEEFVEPETSEYTTYVKSIREYMYYRTQAVLNHDVNLLWDRYPDLKNNIDQKTGINIEKDEIDSMDDVIDANYSIESYEPIKVKRINEQEVIILVHGSISYVKKTSMKQVGNT